MKKYLLLSFVGGLLWASGVPSNLWNKVTSLTIEVPIDTHQNTKEASEEENVSSFYKRLKANAENHLAYKGLSIHLLEGSLESDLRISVHQLKHKDLSQLPFSIVNLTKEASGYGFRPKYLALKKAAEIEISYDKIKIPEGYTEEDVSIFYYDKSQANWQRLSEVKVNKEQGVVEGKALFFSDFIAGIIKLPESPDTSGFMPTSISGLKAANPLGGVQSITPPTANPEGSATTSFNIELPQGRAGMQPNVSLQYSSDAGHSWLGQGWNLSLPSVSIDTRWGSPRYDESKETESYTLAGEELLPNTHRAEWENRSSDKRFYPRREASFSKIIRQGNSPKNYHWKVSSKNGIISYYGHTDDSQLQTDSGNIGYWAITSQEDLKGNNIQYEYTKKDGVLYPKRIYYTGHQGNKGLYSVEFITDKDLGEPQREDIQISARLGFKQAHHSLLRRIEVRYGESLVRAYELIYKKGEYKKTLLKEIKVYDAKNQEFYSNTMEYYNDLRDEAGKYTPFTEFKNWQVPRDGIDYKILGIKGFSGHPTLAGTSSSTSSGGNFRLGIGGASTGKFNEYTVGGNVGHNQGTTESKVFLQDIDGDQLPDKVYKRGSKVSYRKNLSAQGVETFSDEISLLTLPHLGITTSNSYSYGVDLQLKRVMLGYNRQNSKSTTHSYFMDFNGDGLVDFVNGHQVYYNRLVNGVPTFSPSSTGTPAPVVSSGVDMGLTSKSDITRKELEEKNPLHDMVRTWTAPYSGKVKITHQYQLIEDISPERKNYLNNDGSEKADGVQLYFQHNAQLLWKERIEAEDYAIKHKKNEITVKKGDVLFFRLNSHYDGNYDQIHWHPQIEYQNVSALEDINGLSLKTYDALVDGLYSSPRGWIFSGGGQPRLKGLLTKEKTTDKVYLKIYKTNLETGLSLLIAEKNLSEQAETLDLSQIQLGAFNKNDALNIKVESDTEINWQKIKLSPEVEYVDNQGNSITEKVNVDFGIYYAIDEHYIPSSVSSSQEGKLILDLKIQDNKALQVQGKKINGDLLITAKQEGSVVGRKRYKINNGILEALSRTTDIVDIEVKKDLPIFVELTLSDKEIEKALKEATHQLSIEVQTSTGTTIPISKDYKTYKVFVPFNEGQVSTKFGKAYRGWGGFVLNGNLAGEVIDRTKLTGKVGNYDENNPPQIDPNTFDPKQDYPDLEASSAYFIRLQADYTQQRYLGGDKEIYIAGKEMSSGRLGVDDFQIYLDTSLPVLQGGNSIALPMITESKSNAYSAGGNTGGGVSGGASYSEGKSVVKQTMSDFNGDRFPDFIRGGQIQFTTPRGGISAQIGEVGDFSYSKTQSFGGSADGAYTHGEAKNSNTTKTGKNDTQKQNTTTQGIKDAQKASHSASISGNLSFGNDYAEHTYTDMNGDGLADRVTVSSIAYNTGYGFLSEEPWNSGTLNAGDSRDFGAGLGFSVFSGSFKGGINYSQTISDMSAQFLDVTGDGLADKLLYSGADILVFQNLGNRFDTEPIRLPKKDKIAQNKSISMGGGATFSIPIDLPPLFPIIRLSISSGNSFGVNTNRMEATLMDVDGDGHLDYIISDGEDDLKVARSKFRRTNMLKSVKNAAGNSWEIDYEWKAPTYDNPNSQWVLKEVKLFDGHIGDGEDYTISKFEYEKPYYDRRERTFYGYETLKQYAIDPKDNLVMRTSVQHFFNKDYFRKSMLRNAYTLGKDGQKLSESMIKYHIANAKTGQSIQPSDLFLPILDSESIFIAPSENTDRSYEGTAYLEQKEQREYDQNGNITQFFDEGNGTPDSKLTANISYYESQNPYFGGIAKKIEVQDFKGLVRKREAEINPQTAELIKVKNYFSSTEFAQTDLTYDKFGNLKSVTGAENEKGQRAKLEYEYDDATYSHITKIKDQFGYENKMEYDYRFNTPIKTTDRNGETMLYTLDAKGRTTTILAPKEAKAGKPYTIKYEYSPIANSQLPVAKTLNYDPEHDRDIETYTYADGLGRVVQVKKTAAIFKGKDQADEEKHIVSGKQIYDALGRVVETYYPTTAPITASGFQQAVSNQPLTKTQYDDKDRAIEQAFPDGSTTKMAYSIQLTANSQELEATTTDALSRVSKIYTDARGQKTKIVQPTGIETHFEYSAIGELLKVTDAEGHETLSEYDLLGRRTKLVHPDAGTTTLAYDKASNLIRRQTSQIRDEMPSASIIYNYDYNRLQEIKYPKYPDNNVRYHYGKQEDTPSRRGRLWLVEDGSGGVEYFYGDMGEVEKEIRTLRIKPTEVQTYVTEYGYDSWNRIQRMVYPDGEALDFGYNIAGKLTSLTGNKQYAVSHTQNPVQGANSQSPTANRQYSYLKQQGYDEFEQKVYRRLGNDTETSYTYDVVMRRLEALISESQERRNKFQHNRYAYDLVGNILSVENAVNLPSSAIGTLGGSSRYDYEYDELNRLIRAKGNYEGVGSRANYSLKMSYNSLNSIIKKELTHQINGVDKGYTLNYEYNNKKHPHAPSSIAEIGKPKARSYEYDGNGNPVYYDEFKSFRSMLWDEENRLRGINDNGRLHLYTYDHTGERALKSSAESSMAVINGASVASITHTDDYTAYISPYFVVNKGKFTKHFFEGGSRIVSKLGEGTFIHKNTGITAGGVDYLALSAKMQEARDKYIKGLKVPPGPPTQHGIYASPEWTGEPYPSIDWQEISQNQEPPNGWPRPPIFNDPGDVPGPPVQFGDPITNANVKAGYGFVPNGVEEKNIYFYHPDHLGSSSYITDKEGKVIQHTEYMAFGEVLFDEHSVSPKQPYLFNGKELDYETGLYYYGARYYDPKTSIFLNVDPLVEKTGTPYAYVNNNPVNLIDPTGMEAESIHLDKYGNVLKNVDDGDNGVYVHENIFTKEEIDKKYSSKNTSAGGKKIGEIGKTIDINYVYGNTIKKNIIEAKNIFNPFTFRKKVATKGEWDLKNDKNTIYGLGNDGQTQFLFDNQKMESQDIGNHHFGIVVLAYGLFPSEKFILEQAGAYQIKSGTSRPEWQKYGMVEDISVTKGGYIIKSQRKVMLPPYGDDPRDQKWIISGFNYYKNMK